MVVSVALLLVVLLAVEAFVIDLGRLRHDRQMVQSAVDLGSLAGAGLLPVKGTPQAAAAKNEALMVTLANAPQLSSGSVSISFGCVVSDPNNQGGQSSVDYGYVCGPALGTWTSGWTFLRGRSSHACDPYANDLCNSIMVQASHVLPYYFAPVIGITSGSTGSLQAASCIGTCGQTSPLDIVLILDHTSSMTSSDVANVRAAALSILTFYDAAQQWVGLAELPYNKAGDVCNVDPVQNYTKAPTSTSPWQTVPLSHDYQTSGRVLNQASTLVKAVNCFTPAAPAQQTTPPGSAPTRATRSSQRRRCSPPRAARTCLTSSFS